LELVTENIEDDLRSGRHVETLQQEVCEKLEWKNCEYIYIYTGNVPVQFTMVHK